MGGTPYPSKNCDIVFREPFARVSFEPEKKYYIRAIVNGTPEQLIRINAKQQISVMDELVRKDKKLLNACVKCIDGNFFVTCHSGQGDFFEAVDINTIGRT